MKAERSLLVSHQDEDDNSKWLISLAIVSEFDLITSVSSAEEADAWIESLKRVVIDRDRNQMQSYVKGIIYRPDSDA